MFLELIFGRKKPKTIEAQGEDACEACGGSGSVFEDDAVADADRWLEYCNCSAGDRIKPRQPKRHKLYLASSNS